jgi:hypothetical protein
MILGLRPTSDLVGPEPRSPSTKAFLRGMRELGYVYGVDFVTEPRGADGKPERFPTLANELIGLQMDVIVAAGPALPTLKRANSTIPIVMAAVDDPVSAGYVQTLARPGGNITGLSFGGRELHGKRLELLKELVPSAAPVAVLWEGARPGWQAAEAAARARAWKVSRSRFEVLAKSRRRSGRRLTRAWALCSCLRRCRSSYTPNGSWIWLRSTGSLPCTSCGDLSRSAA